jgi:protein-L-isoaspartate(D-aspartate) O-methyltransferase
MPMSPLEQARFNMIEQQIRPWDVLDQTVLNTMSEVPREAFVSEIHRSLAFTDTELPLGHGETMLSPKVEGRILQELALSSDDICLEIGTGSGYLTACMASMANHVFSVEYHSDISVNAQDRLDMQNIFNVTLSTGDAVNGWQQKETDSYNAIAITASMPTYNPVFEEMLKIGGRLFVVVGSAPAMQAMLITRLSETEFARVSLFETVIKPFIGLEKKSFNF